MWLSLFAQQQVSMALGPPGEKEQDVSLEPDTVFGSVADLVARLPGLHPRPKGVVVFTGPGRLTLVRGVVALAMGLGEGWDVPVIGANLRHLLALGWPGPELPRPLRVLTEPVRRWPLVYTVSATGRVSRRAHENTPPASLWRGGPVLVCPTAGQHVPEGATPLPWPRRPAGSLLALLPTLLQTRLPANPARALEYAREAV